MREDNVSRGVKRNALFTVLAVAIIVMASFAVLAVTTSGDPMPLTYEKYAEYRYDVGDSSKDVRVGYDGIVSTEYNPEYWNDTFIALEERQSKYYAASSPGNWFGPYSNAINIGTLTINTNVPSAGDCTITVNDINDQGGRYYVAYTITKVSNNITNVVKSNGSTVITYTATAGSNSVEVSVSVVVHKVFAGWGYSGTSWGSPTETVLPGDVFNVAEGTPAKFTAQWIDPSIHYRSTLDYTGQTASSVTIAKNDFPTPYLVLSYNNSNQAILPDTGTHTYSGYTATAPGSSLCNTMFGYIYLLVEHEQYFGNKVLPTGTYRSYDASHLAGFNAAISISDNSNTPITLTGPVTIDNVDLSNNRKWDGSHGEMKKIFGIFAQGHVLIMGTGITNSKLVIANNTPTSTEGARGSLNIFGGYQNAVLDTPTPEFEVDGEGKNKSIVYADSDKTQRVRIATCVIIHSGVYYNIFAGNYDNNIGTTSSYYSTYAVLKGGSVTDTFSGANWRGTIYNMNGSNRDSYPWNDGDKQENMGGTFAYVTGGFMAGDNWTDSMSYEGNTSDPYYVQRTKYSNVEASVLLGGSSKGAVYGATHVFITDKATVYDAQSGGRESSSYTGFAYMEISGKALVRHVACGTLTNAVTGGTDLVGSVKMVVSGGTVASLYGAGFDTYANPTGRSMTKGYITIDMAGGTVGSLFGGGYRGSIGTENSPQLLTITINMSGGSILNNLYGGGSGGVEKVKHDINGYYDAANRGTVNSSTGYSRVFGNITVNMTGGTVNGDVYGGGMSVPVLKKYKDSGKTFDDVSEVATVQGSTTVNIAGGLVKGSVYGGGRGVITTTTPAEGYIALYDNGKTGDNKITYYTEDLTRTVLLDSSGALITVDWWLVSSGNTEVEYKKVNYVPVSDGTDVTGRYLEFAKVTGNTKVTISDHADVRGSVYGGGALGKVIGSTIVEVTGGVVKENVYGGGLGMKDVASVTKNRTVFISITGQTQLDGDVAPTANQIKGTVYGGSAYGDDGDKVDFNNKQGQVDVKSTVVVEQGMIGYDIFGGGLLGKTYANTTICVGYSYDSDYQYSYDRSLVHKLIKVGSIYAGANIDTDNPPTKENLFKESLVKGYGRVTVYGNNGTARDIIITGSIMGSGNSVRTEQATTVILDSFQNEAQMEGLHRITYLTLIQTQLNLKGRGTMTDVAGESEKTLSVFMIDNFTMKWDSTIIIFAPIDYIGEYHSLNNAGSPTSVTNPANRIVFTSGFTFYVRTMNTVNDVDVLTYNTVEGYTLLNPVAGDYGAYAMCSQNSTGGFTAIKENVLRMCDYYDVGELARYWYVSGITKKVISMKMEYGEETEGNPFNMVTSSIGLMKLQDDSVFEYVGGTFTTASSNSSGEEFTMVRPDTSMGTNEYGFLIGYYDANSAPNTIYAETQHYLDLDTLELGEGSSGSRWVSCSYYDGTTFHSEPVKGAETSGVTVTENLSPIELTANGSAGNYSINFVMLGKPENFTSYIGYLTFTVEETKEVTYTATDSSGMSKVFRNIMVLSTTEIRIDLYILGNSHSESGDFTVPMKLEKEYDQSGETFTYKGSTDVIIASGYTMSRLILTSIDFKNRDGTTIMTTGGTELPLSNIQVKVQALGNIDMTTGWSIVNNDMPVYRGNQTGLNDEAGILLGTIMATIEYEVRGIPSDISLEDYPEVRLGITIMPQTGERSDSTVHVSFREKSTYTITCYHDGVPAAPVYVSEGTVIDSSTLETIKPNFIGWYLDENYLNRYDYSQPIYSDLTLYARYSYAVTFDTLDGRTTKMYVPVNSTGTLLDEASAPVPTALGYDFLYWCSDRNCTIRWDFSGDMINGDTTLYAKWVGQDVWVKFKYWNGSGYVYYGGNEGNDYRITLPNGTNLYPTVKVGSTFSLKDYSPVEGYVLDLATSIVPSSESNNYIHWKLILGDAEYYIDKQTVLTPDMVKWSEESPNSPKWNIILEAETSYVSIWVDMNRGNEDVSTYIAAPQSFLVYPDAPTDMTNSKGHDNVLNKDYYRSETGERRYYSDGHGYYFIKDSGQYRAQVTVDDASYWEDKYGRYWTAKSNGSLVMYYVYLDVPLIRWLNSEDGLYYEFDGASTFTPAAHQPYGIIRSDDVYGESERRDSTGAVNPNGQFLKCYVEEKYKVIVSRGNQYQTFDGTEWVDCNNPGSCHSEDKYGNKYLLSTVSELEMTLYYGSEIYYSFSFVTKTANRNGFEFTGWHNSHVLRTPLYPASGVERTLKMFFHEVSSDQKKYVVVDTEVLETTDRTGNDVLYSNIDYNYAEVFDPAYGSTSEAYGVFEDYLVINDTDKGRKYPSLNYLHDNEKEYRYRVTYVAQWEAEEYEVSLPDNGHQDEVRIHKINNDGTFTLVTESTLVLHYGDKLKLSYTPEGNHVFNRWVATGFYTIDDEFSTDAILVVQGNCSVMASDIHEKTTDLMIYFDNGRLSENDKSHVAVYVHKKGTPYDNESNYIEMTLMNGQRPMELYRGSLPFTEEGESYEVCVRWYDNPADMINNKGNYGDNQFILGEYSPFTVSNESLQERIYYIISGRIMYSEYLGEVNGTLHTEAPNNYKFVRYDTGEVVLSQDIPTDAQREDFIGYISVWYDYDSDGVDELVAKVDRYVGVNQQRLLNTTDIINNPEDNIPPVYLRVAAGYAYSTFEGFPVDDDPSEPFKINLEHNYYSGYAFETLTDTIRFDLNWTRVDKPADVILKLKPYEANPTYTVDLKAVDTDGTIDDMSYSFTMISGDSYFGKIPANKQVDQIYDGKTIIGWYYDKGCTKQVMPADLLDSRTAVYVEMTRVQNNDEDPNISSDDAFFTVSHYVLYAKLSTTSKKTTLETMEKNVAGTDYVSGGTEDLYFELDTKNTNDESDDVYVASFHVKDITGFHIERNLGGAVKVILTGSLNATVTEDKGVVSVSVPRASWSDPTTVTAYYERNSVILKVDFKEYEDVDNSEGQWNDWTITETPAKSVTLTAVYQQSVTVPTYMTYGTMICNGWTISGVPLVSNTFVVGSEDSGTILLSSTYTADPVEVNFITNIGHFSNNFQTITKIMPTGMVLDLEQYFPEADPNAYTFNGYEYEVASVTYHWTSGTYTVEYPVTFTAEWTVNTFTFKYRLADGSDADISAVDYSSNAELPKGEPGTSLVYNTLITLTIKPGLGKVLDVETTRDAYSFMGEPVKLSNDMGYTWSFFLTQNMDLRITTTVQSININLVVDGVLITTTPQGWSAVNVVDSTDGSKTYSWGRNVPLYSTVNIPRIDADSPWYTDSGLTTEMTGYTSGHYTYFADGEITLYTTKETFALFIHDDPSLIGTDRDVGKKHLMTLTDGKITIPAGSYALSGHVFVGWGVLVDEQEHQVSKLTYIPGETLTPAGTSMHLYAYYLKVIDVVEYTYDGNPHYQDVSNDTTINQSSTYNASLDYRYSNSNLFSEDWAVWSSQPSSASAYPVTNVGDGREVYYAIKVTHGVNSKVITGHYMMSLAKVDVYIFAPSASKAYDGTALTVTNQDIKILANTPNGQLPQNHGLEITLKSGNGYSTSLTDFEHSSNIGKARTGVNVAKAAGAPDDILSNYNIHTFDGMLIVYDDESARYAYGGY